MVAENLSMERLLFKPVYSSIWIAMFFLIHVTMFFEHLCIVCLLEAFYE